MLDSEKVALAARIHVMLRRVTGRVTDTEWMAANADYAREIVRFMRVSASEKNAAELAEWASRLEAALGLTQPVAHKREDSGADTGAAPEVPRYLRGIR